MLLVDTNVIVAATDASAAEHVRCAQLLDEHRDLTVTAAVAVESAWMIESRLGPRAEATFVAALAAGELTVVDLTAADWHRCAELIERYHDLGLGVVDAVGGRHSGAAWSVNDRDVEPSRTSPSFDQRTSPPSICFRERPHVHAPVGCSATGTRYGRPRCSG